MPTRSLGAFQRVLLVALLTPVILIAVTAAIPALILLPFLPRGTERAVLLLTAFTTYAGVLLSKSHPAVSKPVRPRASG
jgi:hypothetical protein